MIIKIKFTILNNLILIFNFNKILNFTDNESGLSCNMYTVFQKRKHHTHCDVSVKSESIFKIVSLSDSLWTEVSVAYSVTNVHALLLSVYRSLLHML